MHEPFRSIYYEMLVLRAVLLDDGYIKHPTLNRIHYLGSVARDDYYLKYAVNDKVRGGMGWEDYLAVLRKTT